MTKIVRILFSLLFISLGFANAQVFTGSSGASIGTIPDNGATATCFPLTVSGVGTIDGTFGLATVTVNIKHAFVGDLIVKLVSPDGTTVLLSDRNGGSGQNYTNTVFTGDPTVTATIAAGTAPFSGTFLPEQKIGLVNNGQNADGVWTLCIQDASATKIGRLSNWSLTFNNTPAPPTPVKPPCNANSIKASPTCDTAKMVCDFNGYCGNTSAEYAPPHTWTQLSNAFCGSIENNSFITFVASAATASFNVWVYNSTDGSGIQMFFYTGGCKSGAVTGLQCEFQLQPQADPYVVSASGLTPGQKYYLMFDGFGGDVCDYTVSPVSGVSFLNLKVTPNDSVVCKGQVLNCVATGSNITSYHWNNSIPTADGLNGLSDTVGTTVTLNTSLLPNIGYDTITLGGTVPVGCIGSKTHVVKIVDVPVIIANAAPTTQTVYQNIIPITDTIKLSSNTDGVKFRWYVNTTNSTTGGLIVQNDTLPYYVPPNDVAGTFYYYCEVYNAGCKVSSDVVEVLVLVPPVCNDPDSIQFYVQPTTVKQGLIMKPAVQVRQYCSATKINGTKSGDVTLTVSDGGCGYVSQTKPFVNGIATFDSIVFTRSLQNQITLTATSTGFPTIKSKYFNVQNPRGSLITDVIKRDSFDAITPLSWRPVNDKVVYYGSQTSGDSVGIIQKKGNNYLRKTYKTNPFSGGSTHIFTFENVTGLNKYDSLSFNFKLAALDNNGNTPTNGSAGADIDENLIVETSIDGGKSWATLLTHLGGGAKLFAFATTPVKSLPLNAKATFPSTDKTSAFQVTFPNGLSQFQFRVSATNNRTNEAWCIDDLQLVGKYFGVGIADSLPTLKATGDSIVCKDSLAQLNAVVTHATSPVKYAWSPATAFHVATDTALANPKSDSIKAPTSFSVKIIDNDNCVAQSNNFVVALDTTAPIINNVSLTSDTVCLNSKTIKALSVSATNAKYYQWYQNDSASKIGAIKIPSATSATFFPPDTAASIKYYYCIVTGCGSGAIATNFSGAIVVKAAPSIKFSGKDSICLGQTTKLSVTTTGKYTWDFGPTNNDFTVAPTKDSFFYVKSVDSLLGCSTSDSIKVVVNDAKSPTIILSQPNCSNPTGTATIVSSTTGLVFSSNGTIYSSNSVITNLPIGVVKIYAKDTASGCISTPASGVILLPASAPVVTLKSVTDSCLGTASLSLVGASLSDTIKWYNNGIPIDTFITVKATSGTTVAGDGTLGAALNQISAPFGIALDTIGNVFVSDTANHRIVKWAPGATTGTVVAGGNGYGFGANQFKQPLGIFISPKGDLYVADNNNSRVQKFPAGSTIATNGITVAGGNSNGSKANQLNTPSGIYVDENDTVYVADRNNSRIQKWAPGATSGVTVISGNAFQLWFPTAIARDAAGNFYINDPLKGIIRRYAPGITDAANGTLVATGLTTPSSAFVDRNGDLFSTDLLGSSVKKFVPGSTTPITVAGGNGIGSAANQLKSPASVFVYKGEIYVTDFGNARVQKWGKSIVDSLKPIVQGTYSAVVSTAEGCIVSTNSITVNVPTKPTITITPSTLNGVCSGKPIIFKSTITEGGSSPTYQWQVNGFNVPLIGNQDSVKLTNLKNNDTIRCILKSSSKCVTQSFDTSNAIKVIIVDTVKPTVKITVVPNDTICSGQKATFQATITNGGNAPTFQWLKNNAVIALATSATYVDSTLINNDTVSVQIKSNAVCLVDSFAKSNKIVVPVLSNLTPTVSISANVTFPVCASSVIKFTANGVGVGSKPTFEWRVNNIKQIGATSDTFSTSTLNNNDSIICKVVANNKCQTKDSALSNVIKVSLIGINTINVKNSSDSQSVCKNAKIAPIVYYTTGATGATFSGLPTGVVAIWKADSILISGTPSVAGKFSYFIALTGGCGNIVKAGTIIVDDLPSKATISGTDSICKGDTTKLNVSILGGTSPFSIFYGKDSIKNYVSGNDILVHPSTDTSYIIKAVIDSNGCKAVNLLGTAKITVNKLPVVDSFKVQVNKDSICTGNSSNLLVYISQGTSPYSVNYSSTLVSNYISGSSIAVKPTTTTTYVIDKVVDKFGCIAPKVNFSAKVVVDTNAVPKVSIAIITGNDTICSKDSIVFKATVVNAGTPKYQWLRNGVKLVNDTFSTYKDSIFSNGDLISCMITSSNKCQTTSIVVSNAIKIKVNARPISTVFSGTSTICNGDSTKLKLVISGGQSPYSIIYSGIPLNPFNSGNFITVKPNDTTIYKLQSVIDANGCSLLKPSDSVIVTVNPTPTKAVISGNNAICSGSSTNLFVAINGGTSPFTVNYNGGKILNYNSKDTIKVSPIISTNYYITSVKDKNGCSVPLPLLDTAKVVVNTRATLATISVKSKSLICFGDTTKLKVTIIGGTKPYSVFYGTDSVKNYFSDSSILVHPLSGINSYSLVSVVDSVGCKAIKLNGLASITVNKLPIVDSFKVQLNKDSICAGNSSNLLVYISQGASPFNVKYSSNLVTNYVSGSSIAVKPTTTTTYVLDNVVDKFGCLAPKVNFTARVVVDTNVVPKVNIAIVTGNSTICSKDSIEFKAIVVNAGTPKYQWLRNGLKLVKDTFSTYKDSIFSNGDLISCMITSNNKCQTTSFVVSNSIKIKVNARPTSTVFSGTSTICNGDSTKLRLVISGGQSPYSIIYSGIPLNPFNSGNFITVKPNDTTIYKLQSVIDANGCSLLKPSDSVTVTVNPTPTKAVISGNNTICSGSSTNLFIAINGGTSPFAVTYNGGKILNYNSKDTIKVSPIISTNYYVTSVKDKNGCSVSLPFLDTAKVKVNTRASLATISVKSKSQICAGDTTKLKVTIIGGTKPFSVFYGIDSIKKYYSDSSILVNPLSGINSYSLVSVVDSVGCKVVKLNGTASITVNNLPKVDSFKVQINKDSICAGNTSNLLVYITQGASPYSVKYSSNLFSNYVSGSSIGVKPTTTTTYVLDNVIDKFGCIAPKVNFTARVVVDTNVTPKLSIAIIAGNDTICSNERIVFKATVTNGGSANTYQWLRNGIKIVKANTDIYTDSSFVNGDLISCSITTNNKCQTISSVTSNSIKIKVNARPTATVFSGASTICNGDSTKLKLVIIGGRSPYTIGYNTLLINSFKSGDNIVVKPNSTSVYSLQSVIDANGCSLLKPTGSITVNVNPTPTSAVISGNDTICSGSSTNLFVTISGGTSPFTLIYSGGTLPNYKSNDIIKVTPNSTTNYFITSIRDKNGCLISKAALKDTVKVSVNSRPTIAKLSGSASICEGLSTNLLVTITGGKSPFEVTYSGNLINNYLSGDTINVTPLITTTYALNGVKDANGCSAINLVGTPTVQVTKNVAPFVKISIFNGKDSICAGTAVGFGASVINAGNSPKYQWLLNGIPIIGAVNLNYSTKSLLDNDIISCVVSSNAKCAIPKTDTSNTIVMNVTPVVTPTITISSSVSGAICPGTSVLYTPVVTNVGTNPVYKWYVNGKYITNSINYLTDSLNNNDKVVCTITSSALCAVPVTVSSLPITAIVTKKAVPTISVSSNVKGGICPNSTVIFTATTFDGGSLPILQWTKNGITVGANSSTYIDSTLVSGDLIICKLTSTAACAVPQVVSSSPITVPVLPQLVPNVSISADKSAICFGTQVTFSTSVVNGGANPKYQWNKNRLKIFGATASTYQSSTLLSTDTITCTITSNALCALPQTAYSQPIVINVTPNVTPTIKIVSSDDTICAGTVVVFTATPTNGGVAPKYQWKLNGVNVGTSSTVYTSTTGLNDKDNISCELTSNLVCVTKSTAISNIKTMKVNNNLVPSVSVAVSPTANICFGDKVVFTAAPTNGGIKPVYQWKINGINADTLTTRNTFTDSTLLDSSIVSCIITSKEGCLLNNNPFASSNPIIVRVNNKPIVDKITGTNNKLLCTNKTITVANNTPFGIWSISPSSVATINQNGIITGLSAGTATISYSVTSTKGCGTTVQTEKVTVNTKPVVLPITAVSNFVCKGDNLQFASGTVGGTWSSSKPGIASVNPVTGVVTGVSVDSAIIQYTVKPNGCGDATPALKVVKVYGIDPKTKVVLRNPYCIYPDSGWFELSVPQTIESPYTYFYKGFSYDGPKYKFDNLKVGTYKVDILNKYGCVVDTKNPTLAYLPQDGSCDTLYVPTAFLPGNASNGYNRTLKPFGGGYLQSLSFKIYNRYGNLVFETHDIYSGWDGTMKGVIQEPGTYIWFLEYTRSNGIKRMSKGTSVLIR